MSFSSVAPAADLAKAFAMAARVTPKAGAIVPIVSNLKLAAVDGQLVVSGRNMEATIRINVDAEARGEVTAPAAQLATIASRLDPTKPISMQQTDTVLTITQGRSRFTLPTLPAADLDIGMHFEGEPAEMEVDSGSLVTALKAVEGATHYDFQTKAFLCGACLDVVDDVPMLIATDSHMFSASPLDAKSPTSAPELTIPLTAFPIIYQLAGLSGRLTLTIGKNLFGITAGRVRYETKVVEGKFPTWRTLVPKKQTTKVIVAGDVLRKAMERLTAIGPGQLLFNFEDVINVEATAYEERLSGAGAVDAFEHVSMTGTAVRVALSSENMKWLVGSLPSAETIEIGLTTGDAAVLFKDPAKPHDTRLLMPLRTKAVGVHTGSSGAR